MIVKITAIKDWSCAVNLPVYHTDWFTHLSKGQTGPGEELTEIQIIKGRTCWDHNINSTKFINHKKNIWIQVNMLLFFLIKDKDFLVIEGRNWILIRIQNSNVNFLHVGYARCESLKISAQNILLLTIMMTASNQPCSHD